MFHGTYADNKKKKTNKKKTKKKKNIFVSSIYIRIKGAT